MQLSKRVTWRSIILTLSMLLISVNSTQAKAFGITPNFGAGFGIPYGMFGVNLGLEINVIDSIAIIPNVGGGTTILAGAATNVGVRLLFGDRDSVFRFGFGYWSGTNTIVETTNSGIYGDSDYASEDGITRGINLRFQFGRSRRHGLDIGILKIITPTDEEIRSKYFVGEKQGSDTKISIGYLLRF